MLKTKLWSRFFYPQFADEETETEYNLPKITQLISGVRFQQLDSTQLP